MSQLDAIYYLPLYMGLNRGVCITVLFCLTVILFGVSPTHGYVQEVLFCNIEGTSVTITHRVGETSCFSILSGLAEEINDVEASIQLTQRHIDAGRDEDYWIGVQKTFVTKYNELRDWQEYVVLAMEDYEHDLFIRVKSIISFYLKPEYDILLEKLGQIDGAVTYIIYQGDQQNYKELLQIREEIVYKIWLLENIKNAVNFNELMPFLKIYLRYLENESLLDSREFGDTTKGEEMSNEGLHNVAEQDENVEIEEVGGKTIRVRGLK